MNSAALEPRCWSRGYWWAAVGLIFSGQLGLIFWLSERSPLPTPPAFAGANLQLVGATWSNRVALTDPTLFALPHQRVFSGPAWLLERPQEFHPFAWTEPPHWLEPDAGELGGALRDFIASSPFKVRTSAALPEPEANLAEAGAGSPFAQQSTFQITGDLAGRRLLTPMELRAWTNTDLLTNTVVQVVVDADGKPASATLLSRCGLGEADASALGLAWSARFESLARTGPARQEETLDRLSWGQLVFRWRTLPPVSTNSPAAGP